VYYGVAFTSLFCALFLLLNRVVWSSVGLAASVLAGEAYGLDSAALLAHGFAVGARWTGLFGVFGIGLVFGYGYTIGQRRLRIARVALALPRIPRAWDGLRIVQLSDLHVGPNLERAQLERFVEAANHLDPDLVCITGDIADNPSADLDAFFPILARLRAAHGVFAILGNHDHYSGADRVEAALRRWTPFTVLRDAVASIDVRAHRLHVIGLDDRGRDWARGLHHVPQLDRLRAELHGSEPMLLLCHRPDVFTHAAAIGIPLTLAGHTHGGQLAVPWFGGRYPNLARFMTAFDRGLFERQGNYLYVNCGLGVTGQRIRLCTPREITVIELRAAALASDSPPHSDAAARA
jgi:predicted MPP superfamily phosphohydrolase